MGAFGASLAFRRLDRANLLRLGGILVLAVPIGLARLLLQLLVQGHGLHHLDIAGRMWIELKSLLFYVPALFAAEEVFFRGALDSYLHRREHGRGWFSAAFVSLLWGAWHFPIVHLLTAVVVIELLAAQLFLGLILSWLWRRSGNLAVSGTVHAIIDAVRNALAA